MWCVGDDSSRLLFNEANLNYHHHINHRSACYVQHIWSILNLNKYIFYCSGNIAETKYLQINHLENDNYWQVLYILGCRLHLCCKHVQVVVEKVKEWGETLTMKFEKYRVAFCVIRIARYCFSNIVKVSKILSWSF